MRARLRGQAGQASIEWLAIVAIVAVVLGVAGTAVAGGTGVSEIGHGVTRALARGLCIVRGGVCDADLRPCVVSSDSRSGGWHVRVLFVQGGGDEAIVREDRSDGTVALTRTTKGSLGLAASDGFALGSVAVSVGGSILANHGTGMTWIAQDATQADVWQDALRSHGPMPPPDSTIGSWGADASGEAEARLGPAKAGTTLAAGADRATEVDARTGERTVALEAAVGGGLALLLDVDAALGAGVRVDGEGSVVVVFARDGRPEELVVSGTGTLAGSARGLPAPLDRLARTAGAPVPGGRSWSVDAHLDLGDPDVAPIVSPLVAMVRNPLAHPGGLAEIGALRRLLRERAIVDVRSYSVDEDSGGVGADVEAFGAGVERGAVTTRLLDASTRTIDGSWREREDCLRSA